MTSNDHTSQPFPKRYIKYGAENRYRTSSEQAKHDHDQKRERKILAGVGLAVGGAVVAGMALNARNSSSDLAALESFKEGLPAATVKAERIPYPLSARSESGKFAEKYGTDGPKSDSQQNVFGNALASMNASLSADPDAELSDHVKNFGSIFGKYLEEINATVIYAHYDPERLAEDIPKIQKLLKEALSADADKYKNVPPDQLLVAAFREYYTVVEWIVFEREIGKKIDEFEGRSSYYNELTVEQRRALGEKVYATRDIGDEWRRAIAPFLNSLDEMVAGMENPERSR